MNKDLTKQPNQLVGLRAFTQKHGEPANCLKATAEAINKYEKKLPTTLTDHWKKNGWCSYAQGLIWIVNPLDFEDVLKEWTVTNLNTKKESQAEGIVFARTAFGGMFVWHDEKAHYLDPHYGTIAPITKKLEVLFNYTLCQESYLEKVLDQELYQEVLPRLGAPDYDECYGFVPTLALGGPGTADTLQKLKLREHLLLLAQLKS